MATVDRAVVSASALVAVVGAVLGLLFVLWPELRPDEPPPAMGAELGEAKLEPNVTLGDFVARRGDALRRQAPETREFTPEQLARAGAILTFQAVIEGYEGERCTVRWSTFDAGTGRRLAGPANLVDQDGWPTKYITPTAGRDQVDAEIWLPLPREPGPFFARVELLDPGEVRLASLDSPAFAGAPEPEPTPTAPPSATSAPPVLTPPVFGR
jgi:hypothetical protein